MTTPAISGITGGIDPLCPTRNKKGPWMSIKRSEIRSIGCGLMRPRGAGLFAPDVAEVPCNCLLVEIEGQPVLVDCGVGTRDVDDPSRLGRTNLLLNVIPDRESTASGSLARLGYEPGDVKHVICTHLDKDHAGGLPDFPRATVHVLEAEKEAALSPRTRSERERYRRCHFDHGPDWSSYNPSPENEWFGMECVRGLMGLPDSIMLVFLPGHTRGHCGVAIETDEGWLLHCGDTYYVRGELDVQRKIPAGVRAFRRLAHEDFRRAMDSLERLRRLPEDKAGIELIASHDPGVSRLV